MPLENKYQLEHINRKQSRWGEVFDTIDSNFDKIDRFLADICTRVHVCHVVADADQVDFTVDDPYMTDTNSLAVYRNGVRQFLGIDFDETDIRTFRMRVPCDVGDRIVAVYNEFYLPEDDSSAASTMLQVLTDLKRSAYGEDYDTLDEAIRASLDRARGSVVGLDDELVSEVRKLQESMGPLQTRIAAVLDKFQTGQMFDGVHMIWFTPHVSADGTLTWTNNGGLENPDPVKFDFDIRIPMGTVAIGSPKGSYTYTDAGQHGALVRDRPSLADGNPVPHFGTVPLEFGGLGTTASDMGSAVESYRGPLAYDPDGHRFVPIEGEGALIRDAGGSVRFGVVPVEYGGTGTDHAASGSVPSEGPSAISTLSATPVSRVASASGLSGVLVDDGTLDSVTWSEVSAASDAARSDPSAYRGWIGRTKGFRLLDRSALPPDLDVSGYDFDFGADVTATVAGIGDSGFEFSLSPLLAVYSDGTVPVDADLSDSGEPWARTLAREVYTALLPDEVRGVVADGPDGIALSVPSVGEVGLSDDAPDLPDLDGTDGPCMEYFSVPRDLMADRIATGGGTEPVPEGEGYVLDSTATLRESSVLARETVLDFAAETSKLLSDRATYEPSELSTLSRLLDGLRAAVSYSPDLSPEDADRMVSEVSDFVSSMVPRLDLLSWPEVFDLVYELSVSSPTVADEGDSRIGRLYGMSKEVRTDRFGTIRLDFADASDGIVTLIPSIGAVGRSALRDDGVSDGGYNMALAVRSFLSEVVDSLPEALRSALSPTPRDYRTPDGYPSHVDAEASVPSVSEVASMRWFRDRGGVVRSDGFPITYWTRDVDCEAVG